MSALTNICVDFCLFCFGRKFKKRIEYILSFPVVRQRQEEKRQQEESSKVKERKRKREKYAEKVKCEGVCSRPLL